MTNRTEEAVEREFGFLSKGVDKDSSLWKYLEWVKKAILPSFVKKDSTAAAYQKRHNAITEFIYIASAFVIALVIVQTIFLPDLYHLIWGEVFLIGIMIILQKMVVKKEYQKKWLENRFLAEKLRFAMFTQLFSGNSFALVRKESKIFLIFDEIDQAMERTFDKLDLLEKPGIDIKSNMKEIINFLKSNWLEFQQNYHKETKERKHKLLKRLERICLFCLITTVIAAIAHSLGLGHHTDILELFKSPPPPGAHHEPSVFTVGNVLVVLAIFLPALSAGLNAIKNIFELEKISLRSSKIIDGIGKYKKYLENTRTPKDLEILVSSVEEFFMREHEEWFSLVAHRKPDVG